MCDLEKPNKTKQNKTKKWAHHCIMALTLLIKSKPAMAATVEERKIPQGSPHTSPQKMS
jgi:hypothetical protein